MTDYSSPYKEVKVKAYTIASRVIAARDEMRKANKVYGFRKPKNGKRKKK